LKAVGIVIDNKKGGERMKKISIYFLLSIVFFILSLKTPLISPAVAATPTVASYTSNPPFLSPPTPPLVMLVLARDHKLYMAAYDDVSDLDGDGIIDNHFKPSITYYGYFDSNKFYTYGGSTFTPSSAGTWSGNFLNYLTMSRMDCLRKVLYGGYRSTDGTSTSGSSVTLQRVYVPQDCHCFGHEYTSIAVDGYDIANYAPLTQPTPGTHHLFVSTNDSAAGLPVMRVVLNNPHNIWNWVAKETPECDSSIQVSPGNYAGMGAWNNNSYAQCYDDFNQLESAFAFSQTKSSNPHFLGSGAASPLQINGSGNPFSSQTTYYLTIFNGTINITTGGTYSFAVDGDDAVEVWIDGSVLVGYYGAHGKCGCTTYSASIYLAPGAHSVKFRQEQIGGDSNYYLYWKGPDSSGHNWEIVPTAHFSSLTQSTYDINFPISSQITEYVVQVAVCDPTVGLEANCEQYPSGTYKPTGLLQQYGEQNSMYFGLITGSYSNNLQGGVLRKAVGTITNEILTTTTGQFNTSTNGIIQTINNLKTIGFDYSNMTYDQNCGWIVNSPISNNQCRMWGNPIAEMMYEALRYFAGKKTPTSGFTYSGGDDATLGLPLATWDDPYKTWPYCSKPVMLVISDIYPDFDSDQLPGSYFNSSFSSDLSGLNVTSLTNTIGSFEGLSGSYYIGQSGSTYDGECTSKGVTNLGQIRGLCPQEPTKQGSYYPAAVAYYGHENDLSSAQGSQKTDTYCVALSSPFPKISIPMGSGLITLVPFGKTVGSASSGCVGQPYGLLQGGFYPTCDPIKAFVEQISDTEGTFKVAFADVEEGSDYDMDAICEYHYVVNGNTLTVTCTSYYAAGCLIQHMGYIISGSDNDGAYLVVRDMDTAPGDDVNFIGDTPPQHSGTPLPLTSTMVFHAGTSSAATILKDPLWYAAKWGGFTDYNGTGVPDSQQDWDANGDGVPDNYFYVTNPLQLYQQLQLAMMTIIARNSSGSAVSVLATSAQGEGSLFQAYFTPSTLDHTKQISWLGYLQNLWVDQWGNMREDTNHDAHLVYTDDSIITFNFNEGTGQTEVRKYHDTNGDGTPDATPYAITPIGGIQPIWEAGNILALTNPASRNIYAWVDNNNNGVVDSGEFIGFTTANDATLRPYLNTLSSSSTTFTTTQADNIINFIRGASVSGFRDRGITINGTVQQWKLGDIVYSTPTIVGKPSSNYDLTYSDSTYAAYYKQYQSRDSMVYVGANDGMLHAFWAGQYIEGADPSMPTKNVAGYYSMASGLGTKLGQELWAYIPYNLLPHLQWLTASTYPHVYYVDLKPKVVDAQIFTADSAHPYGWGTVLIGGMRLGGGSISVTDTFGGSTTSSTRTFTSAYFALDITVPQTPKLLWEFTDAGCGFTTSYPTVVKVGTNWFVVFGSGPGSNTTPTYISSSFNGGSAQQGEIFVLDLKTGGQVTNGGTKQVFAGSAGTDSNAFFSDPITVDTNFYLDTPTTYSDDVIYIGESYYQSVPVNSTPTNGKMFRLATHRNNTPANWTLSTLMATRANQPITSAPGVAFDDLQNLWVFFGTGIYMGGSNLTDANQQTFYGIIDPCAKGTCTTTVANNSTNLFSAAPVVASQDSSGNTTVTGSPGAGGNNTTWSNFITAVSKYQGWYDDLYTAPVSSPGPSERVLSQPGIAGGIVFFTTFTPNSNDCGFGGEGTLYGLYYKTGTANGSHPALGMTGTTINKSIDVGGGVPSHIAIRTSQNNSSYINGYIQNSTGAIVNQQLTPPPTLMQSGIVNWRQIP